jgi:polysaccharide biosynthesis protein PslH
MRILYLCHRFPFPPARGGKIRPFNMIRHLDKRHEVVVVSLARSRGEALAGCGIAAHCTRYHAGSISRAAAVARMALRLPTPTPSSMGYFLSPEAVRHVRSELARNDFDLVFVHCSSVAPYVEDFRGAGKILDFGDMDSQKWLAYAEFRPFPLSLGYRLEGIKLRRAEERLARKFDTCTCTTRMELETLESYGAARRTDWFPNGVDSEYFQPSAEPYEPDTISFVGRMDYFPNQQCMDAFCRMTLPLVRARRPRVKLRIIGANPSRAIRRLGSIPGVTVTGSVPDVRPHVRSTAVNVAPLAIARGTQNKILEAMAMGVPVVASVLAAGGVDAVPGRDLLTASTPRECADAIVRLLEDPEERRRFADAARERVLSHHTWERSMRELDRIVDECLTTRGRASATGAERAETASGEGATR